MIKTTKVNGERVKLQIWDTAGQVITFFPINLFEFIHQGAISLNHTVLLSFCPCDRYVMVLIENTMNSLNCLFHSRLVSS